MVICLERDADLHMAQLMPLPLTISCFSKIQIGVLTRVVLDKGPLNWLLLLYRLTQIVLEKGPLNVCVCYCSLIFIICMYENTANLSMCHSVR